jgi:hypothetical protein
MTSFTTGREDRTGIERRAPGRDRCGTDLLDDREVRGPFDEHLMPCDEKGLSELVVQHRLWDEQCVLGRR